MMEPYLRGWDRDVEECVLVSGLAWFQRALWTRIAHGGPCGQPCVRCGRESTYRTRYCAGYVRQILERLDRLGAELKDQS